MTKTNDYTQDEIQCMIDYQNKFIELMDTFHKSCTTEPKRMSKAERTKLNKESSKRETGYRRVKPFTIPEGISEQEKKDRLTMQRCAERAQRMYDDARVLTCGNPAAEKVKNDMEEITKSYKRILQLCNIESDGSLGAGFYMNYYECRFHCENIKIHYDLLRCARLYPRWE